MTNEFRDNFIHHIKSLGWIDIEDRGMGESSGYLFKKDNQQLRFWPRVNRILLESSTPYTYQGSFNLYNVEMHELAPLLMIAQRSMIN